MANNNLLDSSVLLNKHSRQRFLSTSDTITSSAGASSAGVTACGQTTVAPSLAELDVEAALRPDPGTEADFHVNGDNPFAFSPGQLNKLLNPKSLQAFRALGGLRGIAKGLQANLDTGLSADETTVASKITFDDAVHQTYKEDKEVFHPSTDRRRNTSSDKPFVDRTHVYGKNSLPPKKPNPIWKLMWVAFNEKVLILLTVAGTISLALGLYESLGVAKEPGAPPPIDWVEGVAILGAVIIVVLVGSHNDWQKEKAFVKLNTKKDDREVKVLRSGKSSMINVGEILAGDVLFLEPGDLVPTDGIFIQGHGLKCDESSATGESDALKKTGGNRVLELLDSEVHNTKDLDPFIISGSRVLEGEMPSFCQCNDWTCS